MIVSTFTWTFRDQAKFAVEPRVPQYKDILLGDIAAEDHRAVVTVVE